MKRLIVLSVLTLAACQNATPAPPPISGEDAANPTATFSPFATAPLDLLPLEEEGGEAAVDLPEPAGQPLQTVVPETLTTVELHERLNPFNSEFCQLPCYGGLIIGSGSAQDVVAFYSQIGIGVGDLIPGDAADVQNDSEGHLRAWLTTTTDVTNSGELGLLPPQVNVFVEEDVARYLYVGWQYQPPYLSAPQVVEQMGLPDSTQVGVDLSQEQPTYALTLIYSQGAEGAVTFTYLGAMSAAGADQQLCLNADVVDITYMGVFAAGQPPLEGLFTDIIFLDGIDGLGLEAAQIGEQLANGQCLTMPADRFAQWSTN